MSDEKSTPLSSLNNKGDDSNVVNQILDKYNSLEQNPEGTLPPLDKNIPVMEEQFENRDLNKQMFQMASDNTQYKQHADSEQARIQNYEQPPDDDEENFGGGGGAMPGGGAFLCVCGWVDVCVCTCVRVCVWVGG